MKNIKHSNKTNNTFLCCNRGIFSKYVVALKRTVGVAFFKKKKLDLVPREVPQDSLQPRRWHPRRWTGVSHWEDGWPWRCRCRHRARHGENSVPVRMYPPPPKGTKLRRRRRWWCWWRAWRCWGLLLLLPHRRGPLYTLDIKGGDPADLNLFPVFQVLSLPQQDDAVAHSRYKIMDPWHYGFSLDNKWWAQSALRYLRKTPGWVPFRWGIFFCFPGLFVKTTLLESSNRNKTYEKIKK